MKVSKRIETIFAHAVALEQAGRFKNSIHVMDDQIYILNFDSTVLLRFLLRKTEASFKNPVSFQANDYDSSQFHEEGGKIVFLTQSGDFVRKKSCSVPESTPKDIQDLFREFTEKEYDRENEAHVFLHRDVLSLLDSSLSHVEISGVDGKLKIVQRNIYSGSLIEIEREAGKGLGLSDKDVIPEDFGPIGIRTSDFQALYSFCDLLEFRFTDELDFGRFKSSDNKLQMSGIIGHCVYDELGTVAKVKGSKGGKNGWKKQKNRRSVSSSDPEAKKRRRAKRSRK